MAGMVDTLEVSGVSVVEDVLQQHGKRLNDVNLASRIAQEASSRRYEAAGWLRKTVGVVAARDLPAEPSEEDFRQGLRSGKILCNVLNKIQSGAVPKVVEALSDSVASPDGAALSAFQYFENVRNFLVAIEELGIPTFEASDLEQGGKSSRIVNCVLALKSYSDWKKRGGSGSWKYGANLKPSLSAKQFVRKNSEPFANAIPRSLSVGGENSLDTLDQSFNFGSDLHEMCNSRALNTLVRDILSDKNQEEIPIIVENLLSKVTEEFELRLANLKEEINTHTITKDTNGLCMNESPRTISEDIKPSSGDVNNEMEEETTSETKKEEENATAETKKDEEKTTSETNKEEYNGIKDVACERLKVKSKKQQAIVEQQYKELQDLKHTYLTAKADVQLLQMNYQEEVNKLGSHLRGLAQAASGYQKVLEENRKLYNQVQDLKGNIRVYCRVRPFLPGHGSASRLTSVDYIDEGTITVLTPSKYGKEGRKTFNFNRVFGPSATQENVFSDTQPLIRSVLDGFNVCIFAYGQTGSGKTFTMSGPNDLTPETMGVNYRALNDLFLISEQRKNMISYEVSVQMLEIYNEQVKDLLITDGVNKRLEIRNGSQNGINVPDANIVPVTSTDEVINLMNLGHKNRSVGATAMNHRSSRSHSCLTVHVSGRDLTSGTTVRGCMHLVDLAGSERVDKSEVVGDALKEAQHINKSLAALGDVIASLAQKSSHVPYRNSKLTQLLQDALGGQAKTLMFVHISPDAEAIGETLSTLKFAERVSKVELGAAKSNKDSSDVRELKEQIAQLRAALAKKEGGDVSAESSPSHHKVGNGRQPMEEVGNIEARSNIKQNKSRLDLHETSPGDWVDKVMTNKQHGVFDDDNNRKLDSSKIYPEQPNGNLTDESDAATSDCSDTELPLQSNVPKVTNNNNISNGLASKLKKPSPRKALAPQIRKVAAGQRTVLSGAALPAHKIGRKRMGK